MVGAAVSGARKGFRGALKPYINIISQYSEIGMYVLQTQERGENRWTRKERKLSTFGLSGGSSRGLSA